MPVDAIPDLSENQVIVYSEYMGRNPKIMEDQIIGGVLLINGWSHEYREPAAEKFEPDIPKLETG